MKGKSVIVSYKAIDIVNNTGIENDQANHHLYIIKNGSKLPVTNSPKNLGGGDYSIEITDIENSATSMVVSGFSTTDNIYIKSVTWNNIV